MKFKNLLAALCGVAMSLAASVSSAQFANGADVGWVSQQEKAGYSFFNSSGVKTDPFVLLKNLSINSIRLRVWVNPADGWNNGADVLYKAKRAAAQGQRIMIDFHYSDTWADPGHQAKPAAWANHTLAQLNNDVYSHTQGILSYLKSNGVNATKALYPNAKVVLHLANGYDNAVFRWFFDGVKAKGAKWDVIGMSHYPPASDWANYNNKISTNMWDMVSRYAKPVMVTEVGMDWTQAATSKAMVADLLSKTKALGSNGLGVFYWEPQAYPGWQGYTMGALDASGKFTIAMDPF